MAMILSPIFWCPKRISRWFSTSAESVERDADTKAAHCIDTQLKKEKGGMRRYFIFDDTIFTAMITNVSSI
jgi:hypothetical protein